MAIVWREIAKKINSGQIAPTLLSEAEAYVLGLRRVDGQEAADALKTMDDWSLKSCKNKALVTVPRPEWEARKKRLLRGHKHAEPEDNPSDAIEEP